MIKGIEDLINSKTTHILIGILALGSFLRLYHINYQSLWLDELYSIVPTDPQRSLHSIIEYCKSDQPPLFFIYLHYAFKIFGYNEIVGRVSCALIGLIGIPAIYFLGKECFGKTEGVFAAFLTSVNYFHIYYSQELRFYSMAFLFSTLSYLFFIRAFKGNRLLDYLAYAISTICLLYTHYYGLIIFGVQGITFFILLGYRRDFKFIIASITSSVLVLVAFIPWIPTVVNDLGVNVGWIKRPEPFFVAQYFYEYTGKDALTSLILLIFIFLACRTFIKKLISIESRIVFVAIFMWIILSYLIPYIKSVADSPMLSNRYTIVTLPAWIILFAMGWYQIRGLNWKYALVLILVLSAIINLIYSREYYTKIKKYQFREVSEIVLLNNKVGYPVYSSLAWHFNYYFRNSTSMVKDVYSADFSKIDKFWLLQAHFTEEEMEAEIPKNFRIIKKDSLLGANALLLERK